MDELRKRQIIYYGMGIIGASRRHMRTNAGGCGVGD